jgi:hypothetical protein
VKLALYALLVIVPSEICAQNATTKNAPPFRAQLTSPATLQIVSDAKINFPGFGPVECDANGNIYARKDDGSLGREFMRAPVEKLRADGGTSGSFGLEGTGLDGHVEGFFVDSDGEVYLLAWAHAIDQAGYHLYVVKFGAGGSLESKIQLDLSNRVLAGLIAVFKSGEILISGRDKFTPYTGVFASSGKLIKEIYEPEDEELRIRAQKGDPDVLANSNFGNEAVERGGVVVGSDGNAYLMRHTSPALIYAISSHGEVIRKLRINTDGLPQDIHSFAGGLVLWFTRSGGSPLRIVDLEGNPVANYGFPSGFAGTLACYAPPSFTFFDTTSKDDEHLYTAQPK